MDKQLTSKIGHGLQLLLPERRDLDGLLLHGLALAGHPLLVGMNHDVLEVLWVQRVEHVEEVLPWGSLVLSPSGREERRERWILLEHRPNVFDGQLIVMGNLDVCHLRLLHQLLLAS